MPSTSINPLTMTKPGNYSDPFLMIENYIYLHHVDKFLVLPSFVDSVTDSQPVTFRQTQPLSRSAPIYSYASSGPRTIQVTFDLHRDLLQDLNHDISNIPVTVDNDYIDLFIKYIQAATLPTYEAAARMVNPPQVSLRLGNDIFIKGVIAQQVGITYKYPILSNGRYSDIQINFAVSEVDPYDANMVLNTGSFRYVSTNLNRNLVTITGDGGQSSVGSTGRATTNDNVTASTIKYGGGNANGSKGAGRNSPVGFDWNAKKNKILNAANTAVGLSSLINTAKRRSGMNSWIIRNARPR